MRAGPGWRVLLWRRGSTESRSFRLSWPAIALLGGLAFGLWVGGGVLLGLYWAERRESERVSELEAQVARLSQERARVRQLASRLEEIESGYRRIQGALGSEPRGSVRQLRLPLPEGDRDSGTGKPVAQSNPWRPSAWPLATRGFVTRPFSDEGETLAPAHRALDIAVPIGSYVRASGAGEVIEARRDSVYGLYVRIAHSDGLTTLYAHNSWLFVMPGDTVQRLEVIALSGNTGQSTAPHLHFEVERDGTPVDPLTFVPLGR